MSEIDKIICCDGMGRNQSNDFMPFLAANGGMNNQWNNPLE
jgi:hypothetical protein